MEQAITQADPGRVIVACEEFLAHRLLYIQTERDELIDRHYTGKPRLFRQPLTREQVKEELCADPFGEYRSIEWYMRTEAALVRKLCALAQIALIEGSTVQITASVAHAIADFYPNRPAS